MQYITLDELIKEVKETEAVSKEQEITTAQIKATADAVILAADGKAPVRIVTDYDADGICSAYILEQTLRRLNPDIDLTVTTNDRRNPYGVPKDLVPDNNARYIFLDIGSNELDYITEKFGESAIVIDHHPIEAPANAEKMKSNTNYLNPHCLTNGSDYADYCATGLAQRISQEIIAKIESEIKAAGETIKALNTVIKSQKCETIKDFISLCEKEGISIEKSPDESEETARRTIERKGISYHTETFSVTDKKNLYELGTIELAEREGTGKIVHSLGNVRLDVIAETNGEAFSMGSCYKLRVKEGELCTPFDEKFINTRDIMAGIGTIADMVKVLDKNSLNRSIIKTAFDKINDADETNIEYHIGYFLSKCKVDEKNVTSKKLGFDIAPVINAASRMSEITGENGAQQMYDAFTKSGTLRQMLPAIDKMIKLNADRQELVKSLQDETYWATVEDERFGEGKNNNILIYELPENTPTAICGLIAGKMKENIDKPVIALTAHIDPETGKKTWSGSGRGTDKSSSLRTFLNTLKEHQEEIPGLEIVGGGHDAALGITRITDIEGFKELTSKYQDEICFTKSEEDKRLLITIDELQDPITIDKLKSLEPFGNGLTLPLTELEGKEINHGKDFKANNPNWKTIKIKVPNGEKTAEIKMTDWSYSENNYPVDEKGNIAALGRLEINDFRGEKLEFTVHYDKEFLAERIMLIDASKTEKQADDKKTGKKTERT